MKSKLLLLLLCCSGAAFSQFHIGVFAGGSNYLGELNTKLYARTKPAAGLSLNYEISDRVMLRSGVTFGKFEGSDQFSSPDYIKQIRNLSFQSRVSEFSLLGELTVFNLYNINWSPYFFGGFSVYHFNPYVIDSGAKIYLQPLGTEGQGTSQYPGRKPYALTQLAVPFGGGVKFNLSDNIRLGVEVGLRRLFTDYLDDVSTTYADQNEILAMRGPQAVRFSYRGGEVPGETAAYPDFGYPAKDAQRGNPASKDWFYFSGIHLTFRIGGGYGKTASSGKNKGFGCPTNPM
ncbi:MAG TPA: DUF6089 family protein [Flavisolibacter sp.]|jgi:hypothetical protein|nr:DUF6089 family protein [Flavisolibacter sp.]